MLYLCPDFLKDIYDTTGYCLECEKIVDACDYTGRRMEDILKRISKNRKK